MHLREIMCETVNWFELSAGGRAGFVCEHCVLLATSVSWNFFVS
jgi:hypothetical protein